METSVLPIVEALYRQGHTAHIYGSPSDGWFCKGVRLLHASYVEHDFIYDEYDRRVYIAIVTSECGITGVAVYH